jgi:hypothetical protein
MRTILEGGTVEKKEVVETNKNDKSDDGEGLDAVQPKAVKKKFADRKDKDIDNDGDTDSSDEYMHKKRKAISKSMSKEEVEEVDEGELPPALQKAIDKKKGKDTDDDDSENDDSEKSKKKEMKEDFRSLIEKYGLEFSRNLLNAISE